MATEGYPGYLRTIGENPGRRGSKSPSGGSLGKPATEAGAAAPPFPKEAAAQGEDSSPVGQQRSPSACHPSRRLPGEVGGGDAGQGGDAQGGEVGLATASPWKGESAAPPCAGHGASASCPGRQHTPCCRDAAQRAELLPVGPGCPWWPRTRAPRKHMG